MKSKLKRAWAIPLLLIGLSCSSPAYSMGVIHTIVDVASDIWRGIRVAVLDMVDIVPKIFGAPIQVICYKDPSLNLFHLCSGYITSVGTFDYRGYEISFNDGTDYNRIWTPQGMGLGYRSSINKLFGYTDCGHLGNAPQIPSAMLGWRNNTDDFNKIDIVGFANRPSGSTMGSSYYFDFVPLVTIPRYSLTDLSIQKIGPHSQYYLFSAGGRFNAVMSRDCTGSDSWSAPNRTIGPWFGGQKSPPVNVHMRYQSKVFSPIDKKFPKYLSIEIPFGEKALAPTDTPGISSYLINHPSQVYSTYIKACTKHLQISSATETHSFRDRDTGTEIQVGDPSKAYQYVLNCN